MRIGVTREQVDSAAEAIRLNGETPTAHKIRKHLGTGSLTTIYRLLAELDESQKLAAPAIEVSPELMRSIQAALARTAASARADAEKRILALQEDNVSLAQSAADLESENTQLNEKMIDSQRQTDIATGKALRQEKEIENLSQELDSARAACENARLDLVKETVKSDERQALNVECSREIERLRSVLAKEHSDRIAAEQAVAVLNAQLKGASEQGARQDFRIAELEKTLTESNANLHAASERNHALATSLSSATSAHRDAIQDVQRLYKEAQGNREDAKRAEREASELRGRLYNQEKGSSAGSA